MACTLLLAGLPPLATFLGKLGMLSAAIASGDADAGQAPRIWMFVATLLVSGMLVLMALMRTGIRIFWAGGQRGRPRVTASEGLPVVGLLGITGLLVVAAGPAMAMANAAARSLYDRSSYVAAVLASPVRESPSASSVEP